jgi:hypothetical protein
MNTVEDRVRAALRAHAEDFTASADAWERVEARSAPTARRRPAVPSRLTPSRRFLRHAGPAATAAAVIAVVVAATLTGQALSHHPAGGVTPAASGSDTPGVQGGGHRTDAITEIDKFMLKDAPPTTPVVTMRLGGPTMAAVSFWLRYDDPHAWSQQVTSGLQFCQADVGMGGGQGGSGHCGPGVPNLGGLPVVPTGPDAGVDSSTDLFYGIATKRVASVTAVLRDGREYPGQVRAAPGLPERVWAVKFPGPAAGVHVVFRDAAGHGVATIAATVPLPDDPNQSQIVLQPPATGGIPVFQYPAAEGTWKDSGVGGGPGGTMTAYLVDGHVVFWSNPWGALVSPSAIPAGQPALAGVAAPFELLPPGGSSMFKQLKAFGYAHFPVTRVVLRLADGRQFPATLIAAGNANGWLGTDFRLWWVNLPISIWNQSKQVPPITVIGYNAAGHVVTTAQLGFGPISSTGP